MSPRRRVHRPSELAAVVWRSASVVLRFGGDLFTPTRFAIDSRGSAAVIYMRGRSLRLVTLAFGARRTVRRRLRVPRDAADVFPSTGT